MFPSVSAIDSALTQEFLDLIWGQTGLKVRTQDWETLATNIMGRVKSLQFPNPQAYYQHLVTESSLGAEQQQEWKHFLNLITIGESYFFRDQDQFQVLREHILPDLIARRRAEYSKGSIPNLTLRLWSAGCSTGEEPYSLAMLLQELIPDIAEWDISIFGTDLNPASLEKARQGIYRDWSFRHTEPTLKSRFFCPVASGWKIHNRIQQSVIFREGNLVKDLFPNAAFNTLDLIVCRNVFIYFDAPTIGNILEKFNAALSPDGYLITGHAELYAQNLNQFAVQSFSGSMAYQRQAKSRGHRHPHKKGMRPPVQPSTRPTQKSVTPQTSSPRKLSPRQNPLQKPFPKAQPKTQLTAQFLLAQSHWQRKELEQAMHHCDAALQMDGEALEPLYLKAQIAHANCDRKQAKTLLKKLLYLHPFFIPAYLELGSIYAQNAQNLRANKMYRTAQDLLAELPPETWINYQGKITARDLSRQLNHKIPQTA